MQHPIRVSLTIMLQLMALEHIATDVFFFFSFFHVFFSVDEMFALNIFL